MISRAGFVNLVIRFLKWNCCSAAGTDFTKVIKTTCFLADTNDFDAINSVYGKYLTSKPARSCVSVKALPKGVLIEVEAVAVL